MSQKSYFSQYMIANCKIRRRQTIQLSPNNVTLSKINLTSGEERTAVTYILPC